MVPLVSLILGVLSAACLGWVAGHQFRGWQIRRQENAEAERDARFRERERLNGIEVRLHKLEAKR